MTNPGNWWFAFAGDIHRFCIKKQERLERHQGRDSLLGSDLGKEKVLPVLCV